jgi:NAD(P)H-flavin reductase
VRVQRLAPRILEIVIHAPMAAQNFQPGQFFKLQNFESSPASFKSPREQPSSQRSPATTIEPLALTGAWVDQDAGLIGTVVLEMGASSNACADLQEGERVVLMGPTGAPTTIPSGETVVLIGGGLGNAVLFSIGAAMRAAGSRVLYFAGYRTTADRFRVADLEAAADTVVWCCDQTPGFTPGRAQDLAFQGNVVEAMKAYGEGLLGQGAGMPIRLQEANRMLAIGSDRMMAAVAKARHHILKDILPADHIALGSINSPMQCMLKGVCGQCLQWLRDPETGQTRFVFSCHTQDQPLDAVDFAVLQQRLAQNRLEESQTLHWLDACVRTNSPAV